MPRPKEIRTLTSYIPFSETMDAETGRRAKEELADSVAERFKAEIIAAMDPKEPGENRLRVSFVVEFEKTEYR